MSLTAFKTYDVRGKVPAELNPAIAESIAAAFAETLQPARVAVGHDCRLTSPELAEAICEGLLAQGVDVYPLGLCGTEETYFAAFSGQLDGAIMVTASHNPAEYNGLKFVGKHGAALTAEQLAAVRDCVGNVRASKRRGAQLHRNFREQYLDWLAERFPPESLAQMKTVANAGNGAIGPLLLQLAQRFNLPVVPLLAEPDGTFPNGIPNPLLPEKRELTSQAVREHGAALGVAWDGDFDRCFFWNGQGEFLESYYLVGMLARHFLRPGPATIAYDPRLTWNTEEIVTEHGGQPLLCRTGHVFFKRELRRSGALYGGEMSGHHYFHSFGCCDSGVIPWLMWLQIEAATPGIDAYLRERAERFPISGEINRSVADQKAAIARVEARFAGEACVQRTEIDGLSLAFPKWRFNLRSSNTEPLIRLNVETRGDRQLLEQRTEEILGLVDESS